MNEIKLNDSAVRALSDTETRLIAIPPELEMPPLRSAARQAVDVDFSLAIHNRTGKYFIGEELLSFADLPLGKTYYWWQAAARPLEGFYGRVMGRLQHWQILGKTIGGPLGWLPRRTPKRPLLHLDPFTVPTTVLRPIDAVLIHDLGPLTHPALFPPDVCAIYRHIYDEIARVGPHLVFVSYTSRKEFEDTAQQPHHPSADQARYRGRRGDGGGGGGTALPAYGRQRGQAQESGALHCRLCAQRPRRAGRALCHLRRAGAGP